jgi:hypothetical protein
MKRLVAELEARRAEWLDLLRSFACFEQQLRMIPLESGGSAAEPHWSNAWIPGLDAGSLYAFTAQKNPGVFLEVGSGNSTKFVRKAIDDHGLKTKIVAIDPSARGNRPDLRRDSSRRARGTGSRHIRQSDAGRHRLY